MQIFRIVVDEREKNSSVHLYLRNMGVRVLFRRLSVADYVLSGDCAVERKNVKDFVKSIVDGRLFDQAYRLSQAYSRSSIIVEGDVKLAYSSLKAGSKSFWGALAYVWMVFGVPSFFTLNERETAELIHALIKHEQGEVKKRIYIRSKPKLESLADRQLFVVQSFPGVGPKLALRLLKTLGSIKNIVNASPAELSMIEGLGRQRAIQLVNFFNSMYREVSRNSGQVKLDDIGVR